MNTTPLASSFAEHMALMEPLSKPGPLGLHARVGLLAAYDAAQMLPIQIFFCQIEKLILHVRYLPENPSP